MMPKKSKLVDVQTKAFDYDIKGVLMQNGHSVTFTSQKLNDLDRMYIVHDKEMILLVHFPPTWRHYLLRLQFIVKMDNISSDTNCYNVKLVVYLSFQLFFFVIILDK